MRKPTDTERKALQFAADSDGELARAFGMVPAWGWGKTAFGAEVIKPCIAAGWLDDSRPTFVALTAAGRAALEQH